MRTLACPGKIVLFGEWAVLKGSPALSIAITQLCKTQYEIQEVARGRAVSVHWKTPLEELQFPNAQEEDLSFLEKLLFQIKPQFSAELKSEFEWDLSHGLGSSSALVLSAMGIFSSAAFKTFVEMNLIWLEARKLQQALQGGKGSGIDLAAQICGGAVVVQGDSLQKFELKLPPEIFFLHSGKKHSTAQALEFGVPTDLYKKISKSSEQFLGGGVNPDWEKAISEHNLAFRDSEILDSKITELSTHLKQSKISASLKSCGAGGSETIMVFAEVSRHEKIREIAERLGFKLIKHQINPKGFSIS